MLLLASLVFCCYTNHAGFVACGAPVKLDARTVVLSNAAESVTLPLSVFPEPERRRIAADYVLAHPEAGVAALRVPDAVKKAVEANERSVRRARLRFEKGLCKKEESDTASAKSESALAAWLDAEEKKGTILPAEHRALGTGAAVAKPETSLQTEEK